MAELFRANKEHSRDGDFVQTASLRPLAEAIRFTWQDYAAGAQPGGSDPIDTVLRDQYGRLDERMFVDFIAGVLQRQLCIPRTVYPSHCVGCL